MVTANFLSFLLWDKIVAEECAIPCDNYGQCVNGQCVCQPGFQGDQCQERGLYRNKKPITLKPVRYKPLSVRSSFAIMDYNYYYYYYYYYYLVI